VGSQYHGLRCNSSAFSRTSFSSRPRKPATAAIVMPRSIASLKNSTSESNQGLPVFGWDDDAVMGELGPGSHALGRYIEMLGFLSDF
jgi:hypothetical protein